MSITFDHSSATTVAAEAVEPTRAIAPDTLDVDATEAAEAADATASEQFWTVLVDKVLQSALLLILVKLLSGWAVVAAWSVPMDGRFVFGFIPYVGLATTPAEFRTVAAWSTAITAGIAILWLVTHFLRRKRNHPVALWGAAAAVPMASTLTVFEWVRRFNGDHLLPTGWMFRILLVLAVAGVLFLGFADMPNKRPEAADGQTDSQRRQTGASRPSTPLPPFSAPQP